MHAYLFAGGEISNLKVQISNLAEKLGAEEWEFPIKKIEDTRNLNDLIRLSFDKPTLIIAANIHEAGEEALNAFLKNLEEPQENIYFALTAPSIRKVLPTIVSRCQIIKVAGKRLIEKNEEVENFLTFTPGQRMAFFDKMRDRNKATAFIESLIFCLHERREMKNMEILINTLKNLSANRNVNLQLTNLITHYV